MTDPVNPVLEPAAQAFANANSKPPFRFQLAPVIVYVHGPAGSGCCWPLCRIHLGESGRRVMSAA